MKKREYLLLLSMLLFSLFSVCRIAAQTTYSIRGKVIDKTTRDPLSFISVNVYGKTQGAYTDSAGNFTISRVPSGIHRLQAASLGYKSLITPEYILTAHDLYVNIELEENTLQLGEILVSVPASFLIAESPVGVRTIGLQEIEKSPGANRDISRIVQSYPGVAFSPTSYRNDLIVRGGGPSENRFYMDGVEIPNINHFSTQGASGGPVGLINADLIREVNFFTSAFPSNRGNALSSVMDISLRDGNPQKQSFKATVGASELSLAANGSIDDKTTYLVSVRRSYLEFLFKALGLPFLPTFTDAQFKVKRRFSEHHELTFLGLGGIDNMNLSDTPKNEDAEYILNYLPHITQQTFTLGAVYKHYAGAHVQTVVVSHNFLNNNNTKYKNNADTYADSLTLRLGSTEQDTRLRFEELYVAGNWEFNSGVSLDYSQYSNNTFQKLFLKRAIQEINYRTSFGFLRWGLFSRATYEAPDERFIATASVRIDGADYSDNMRNPLEQFSPRLSLSYRLVDNLYWSGALGRYYQLPPSTAMGFKSGGEFINKSVLHYMLSDQISTGFTYSPGKRIELTAELFYKKYDNIPVSLSDSIPLTCKGNDYGVIGNEALTSGAQGRSYGFELLAEWRIPEKLMLSSSFTLFKSEYRNSARDPYIVSSWDNRYIFNVRGTYNFSHHWSLGLKYSLIGGAPYTPYDLDKSSLITAWDVQGRPYFDYSKFNTRRLNAFGQLDLRVDKTFYIRSRYMLGIYLDIQNITNSTLHEQDVVMSTGSINPADNTRYLMKSLKRNSGTLLPTIGLTFEL